MVYLDSAAATPLDPRVFEAMRPWLTDEFANPNATYQPAQRARAAIDDARMTVAKFLNAKATEIIFTGSGTESCNMAIRGVVEDAIVSCHFDRLHSVISTEAEEVSERGEVEKSRISKTITKRALRDLSTSSSSFTTLNFARDDRMSRNDKKIHLITSAIEHSSVLKPIEYLQKLFGIEITIVPVNREGIVNVQDVRRAIRPNTVLVSIMLVNNQIGTIQPVAKIGAICRQRKILFHTDACQGPGYLEIDVQRLNVDLLSLNASKIYGPKGVGVLYIREGIKIAPLIHGGSQEFKLRAGTENVAGIVGMGKAVSILSSRAELRGIKEEGAVERSRIPTHEQIRKLRDTLWQELQQSIKGVKLNGSFEHRIANNLNIQIPGVDADTLVKKLDLEGICVATTAACVSGITKPSHVLKAIGLTDEEAKSSIRITLGKYTTEHDIHTLLKKLKKLLNC